jgi:hypothetical protein
MQRSAQFSPCRTYRYSLWRAWPDLLSPAKGYAMFIGLNPSTADETADDPTIRRCIGFARAWGYEGLCMTNLFAFRATDPADMLAHPEPVGNDNDHYLVRLAQGAALVVAAWGAHGRHRGRDAQVVRLLPALHCLRLTRGGSPAHPLYLPKALLPVQWSREDTTAVHARRETQTPEPL